MDLREVLVFLGDFDFVAVRRLEDDFGGDGVADLALAAAPGALLFRVRDFVPAGALALAFNTARVAPVDSVSLPFLLLGVDLDFGVEVVLFRAIGVLNPYL